jgi:hypothetical protein
MGYCSRYMITYRAGSCWTKEMETDALHGLVYIKYEHSMGTAYMGVSCSNWSGCNHNWVQYGCSYMMVHPQLVGLQLGEITT